MLDAKNESIEYIHGYISFKVLTHKFFSYYFVEKDDMNTPIWAIIFYSLRCGQDSAINDIFNHYSGSLSGEIQQLAVLYNQSLEDQGGDKNLTQRREEIIQARIFTEEKIDVFKGMIYVIIAKNNSIDLCEFDYFMEVIDNYIWIKLKLVIFNNDSETQKFDSNLNVPSPPDIQDSLSELQEFLLSTRIFIFNTSYEQFRS